MCTYTQSLCASPFCDNTIHVLYSYCQGAFDISPQQPPQCPPWVSYAISLPYHQGQYCHYCFQLRQDRSEQAEVNMAVVQGSELLWESSIKDDEDARAALKQERLEIESEARKKRIWDMQTWIDMLVVEERKGLREKGTMGEWLDMMGQMEHTLKGGRMGWDWWSGPGKLKAKE